MQKKKCLSKYKTQRLSVIPLEYIEKFQALSDFFNDGGKLVRFTENLLLFNGSRFEIRNLEDQLLYTNKNITESIVMFLNMEK